MANGTVKINVMNLERVRALLDVVSRMTADDRVPAEYKCQVAAAFAIKTNRELTGIEAIATGDSEPHEQT